MSVRNFALGGVAVVAVVGGIAVFHNGRIAVAPDVATPAASAVTGSTSTVPSTESKPLKFADRRAEAISALSGSDSDRWISTWRSTLSQMTASELWDLMTDPGVSGQREAKTLRDQMIKGCTVAVGIAEKGEDQSNAVSEWCSMFARRGGMDYLREQSTALMQDADLQSAPHQVLGPQKLRGTQAERAEEISMLESALRQAKDPWTAKASLRSLWAYRSQFLLDDWSAVEQLSKFQQERIRHVVSLDYACRMTSDCDANSVWVVELCALSPGLICPRGAGMDQVLAQNLSPAEIALIQKILSKITAVKS
ncbi:hypothetical protein [Tahibacter amnicola]|uniref:Secreted protein n=1 Tax=Tahibacter amnicola TaxID=2976241 RepID=A0ABY6BCM9_9GAMM|nr:hypothetical protein [Tahibacter amnicola]UXI67297.1 hypothetical protein N4264_21545 [Tahibacter amnicola]